ncbi:MAG: tail fiber domain-containing protein [Pseudomonadales bacterium]|nr:tail fiber domain-containing protein [Pseudomonadales bacterium]
MGWLSTPKPDPAVGQAAMQQAELSREMAGVAREELAFGREQYERFAPMYERLMGVQSDQAAQDSAFAAEQMGRYRSVFQPVEDRVVGEAMSYDSPQEVAARQGRAAATVQGQFDAARGQNERQMAAMGVSPDSGRSVQAGIDQSNQLALAKAGAVNQEATNSKLMGMQLRQQAAGLGRGAAGMGLQGSQLATGAAGAGIGGANATLAGRGAALQPALAYTGSASQTGASAAGILNQQHANMVNAYGHQSQAYGGLANSAAGIAGAAIGAGMFMSDERAKENIEPVDGDAALISLRRTPVSKWDYKPGMGDGGTHVGPMAQDVNAAMGEQAAPGGTAIDPITLNGVNMAAIKALDAKVTALTKMVKGGGREASPPVEDARLVSLKSLRM